MATLYVGNTMRVKLAGGGKLLSEKNEPVPGATVEATLYQGGSSTEVAGVTWPITLTEDGKEGEYFGDLPASAEVSVNVPYIMVITAESPGGARAEWRETVDVQYRDF